MRETCVAVLLCIVHMFNSGNFVFISKKKKKINNLNDGGDRRPQPDVLWDTDIRRRIANPPDQSLCSGDMAIWRYGECKAGGWARGGYQLIHVFGVAFLSDDYFYVS